jgi:hypothetical protein
MSCRQCKAVWAAALCASLLVCFGTRAADAPQDEAVEADYLYRFASYVEWPGDALSGPQFTIAVLGDDQMVQALQRILPGHLLQNRPATVRPIRRIQELGAAQILFVGPHYTQNLRPVIDGIAARPVLIVTARDHGLDDGSCVNFVSADRRVRFEVSTAAADHAGLRISAELLSVAVRVAGRGAR